MNVRRDFEVGFWGVVSVVNGFRQGYDTYDRPDCVHCQRQPRFIVQIRNNIQTQWHGI